ncbi:MAG: PSD1 and planctomycete cytochrome C domain-containing protein [Pirellulales bacterium]|nr:PSD1 and planctomycete cytochrome C domain-containing protein [Pirellulales bacterium]
MQHRFARLLILSGSTLLGSAFSVPGAEVKQENAVFFEKHIRPILVEHCYECHSEQAGKRKGGLLLDRKAGWETGGDSGPAIVPGDAADSLLIESVHYEAYEMPPEGKLPDKTIALLEEWVRRGAFDPRLAPGPAAREEIDIEAGRQFWCFQPVTRPTIPVVTDKAWPLGDIDHLILAKLEDAEITPAPDANREAILRRVTLALTGLPPTVAEQDAFLADQSPGAFERVVDYLLESDAFAECWARHWLDIIRYADSVGGGGSQVLKDSWRLRDYVIDSFRRDKPLNKMIREHIAGDLLPFSSYREQVEQLTATGFLVLGPHNYGGQDKDLIALDIADEQIDTIGKAFLGMTIGCARCHDHKFDPIPTSDYYALAGIFLSTKSVSNKHFSSWFTRTYPMSPEQKAELDAGRAKDKAKIVSLTNHVAELKKRIKAVDKKANPAAGASLRTELQEKQVSLKGLQKKKPPKQPTIMCVGEVDEPKDTPIRVRGQPRNIGETVSRGFLQVAMSPDKPAPKLDEGSGRLELAHWIASDENPLTARVLANRIWQHLLGHGIVRSSDNFGNSGNLPTHPELLDYLAVRLIQNGWSTRQLVREIVLSRTWRMASEGGDPDGDRLDIENELLWRAHKRRLNAEALRDSILMLSGTLDSDSEKGGPSLPPGLKSAIDFEFTSMKRSIYIPVFRNRLYEIFGTFDFANPNFVVSKRFESTIPTQSLYLMNSPFIHHQAQVAAQQFLEKPADTAAATRWTYRHILCRSPSDEEMALTHEFLESEDFSSEAWASLIQSLYSCVDFQYIH